VPLDSSAATRRSDLFAVAAVYFHCVGAGRRLAKMEAVESECAEALTSPTTPGFAAALLKHHDA